MKKIDLCPVCRSVLKLKPRSTWKMFCPKSGCTFVDKRRGPSSLPENTERRGSLTIEDIEQHNCPWRQAQWK